MDTLKSFSTGSTDVGWGASEEDVSTELDASVSISLQTGSIGTEPAWAIGLNVDDTVSDAPEVMSNSSTPGPLQAAQIPWLVNQQSTNDTLLHLDSSSTVGKLHSDESMVSMLSVQNKGNIPPNAYAQPSQAAQIMHPYQPAKTYGLNTSITQPYMQYTNLQSNTYDPIQTPQGSQQILEPQELQSVQQSEPITPYLPAPLGGYSNQNLYIQNTSAHVQSTPSQSSPDGNNDASSTGLIELNTTNAVIEADSSQLIDEQGFDADGANQGQDGPDEVGSGFASAGRTFNSSGAGLPNTSPSNAGSTINTTAAMQMGVGLVSTANNVSNGDYLAAVQSGVHVVMSGMQIGTSIGKWNEARQRRKESAGQYAAMYGATNPAVMSKVQIGAQLDEILLVLSVLGQRLVVLNVVNSQELPRALSVCRIAVSQADTGNLLEHFDTLDGTLQYTVTAALFFCAGCWPMHIYRGFGTGVINNFIWGCPHPQYNIGQLAGFNSVDRIIAFLKSMPQEVQLFARFPHGLNRMVPLFEKQHDRNVRRRFMNAYNEFVRELEKRGHPPPRDRSFPVHSWHVPFATWNSAFTFRSSGHYCEDFLRWQMDPGRLLHAWTIGGHLDLNYGELMWIPTGPAESIARWLEGLPGTTFRLVPTSSFDYSHLRLSPETTRVIWQDDYQSVKAVRDLQAESRRPAVNQNVFVPPPPANARKQSTPQPLQPTQNLPVPRKSVAVPASQLSVPHAVQTCNANTRLSPGSQGQAQPVIEQPALPTPSSRQVSNQAIGHPTILRRSTLPPLSGNQAVTRRAVSTQAAASQAVAQVSAQPQPASNVQQSTDQQPVSSHLLASQSTMAPYGGISVPSQFTTAQRNVPLPLRPFPPHQAPLQSTSPPAIAANMRPTATAIPGLSHSTNYSGLNLSQQTPSPPVPAPSPISNPSSSPRKPSFRTYPSNGSDAPAASGPAAPSPTASPGSVATPSSSGSTTASASSPSLPMNSSGNSARPSVWRQDTFAHRTGASRPGSAALSSNPSVRSTKSDQSDQSDQSNKYSRLVKRIASKSNKTDRARNISPQPDQAPPLPIANNSDGPTQLIQAFFHPDSSGQACEATIDAATREFPPMLPPTMSSSPRTDTPSAGEPTRPSYHPSFSQSSDTASTQATSSASESNSYISSAMFPSPTASSQHPPASTESLPPTAPFATIKRRVVAPPPPAALPSAARRWGAYIVAWRRRFAPT